MLYELSLGWMLPSREAHVEEMKLGHDLDLSLVESIFSHCHLIFGTGHTTKDAIVILIT